MKTLGTIKELFKNMRSKVIMLYIALTSWIEIIGNKFIVRESGLSQDLLSFSIKQMPLNLFRGSQWKHDNDRDERDAD